MSEVNRMLCSGYIQVCRGLMISSVCLGFFGSIFALIGMKCTKIGGLDQTKARVVCFAGLNFICTGKFSSILMNMIRKTAFFKTIM